jgi:hypothetical protein
VRWLAGNGADTALDRGGAVNQSGVCPFHESGRAGLLVSPDARRHATPPEDTPRRVPTRFRVTLRDSGIVEAPLEPSSGTGVSPVRIETHGRDAHATDAAAGVAPVQGFKTQNSIWENSHPDPLPLGEGESSATAGGSREPEVARRIQTVCDGRWLSPSPSGRDQG